MKVVSTNTAINVDRTGIRNSIKAFTKELGLFDLDEN